MSTPQVDAAHLFHCDRMSPRARAIARGLVRSGRARSLAQGRPPIESGLLRLDHPSGARFFWLSLDGARLSRGRDVVEAEALQQGFLDRMAQLGGWRDNAEKSEADADSVLVPATS